MYILLFVIVAVIVYFAPHVLRYTATLTLEKSLIAKRRLVLTYDDGPSELTLRILDLLRSKNVKATFFVLGRKVAPNQEIIQQLVEEGHELGSHGYDHIHAWKTMPWNTIRDIKKGREVISQWLQPSSPYRPPYGKLTLPMWIFLKRCRQPIYWWTIDSGDTFQSRPRPDVVAEVLKKKGGGVVLMHDFTKNDSHMEYVLETTRQLLDIAERNDINVLPLKQACGACD